MRWILFPAAAFFAAAMMSRVGAVPPEPRGWEAEAAGQYLDERMAWWRDWPKADRDHGTKCISCHTSLPHTLAAPALRAQPGQAARTPAETAMFDDVVKRVYLWEQVAPFYPDQTVGIPKSSESRGVEAVLNALVLATRDQERGHFGPDTRQAFANMWSQQLHRGDQEGSFAWLNFNLEPFESASAVYWGATLASLAVARAPAEYRNDPSIAPNLAALRSFLRSGLSGSLYTRTLLLWSDSQLHSVLEMDERQNILDDIAAAQGPDGGWSLPSLSSWQRVDPSSLPTASDGYATAVITLALREAGVPLDAEPLKSARTWLAEHQDAETGAMPAVSINKDRQPGSDAYLFMTDAATGMAALAMRPEP